MYIKQRDNISQLLSTVLEALEFVRANKSKAIEYIDSCVEALESVIDYIKEFSPEFNINAITTAKTDLIKIKKEKDSTALSKQLKQSYKNVEKIRNNIQNIKVKYKAVFLPYKASMWTSLESIWQAAMSDQNCTASVVVIPYYELDAESGKAELLYEADKFPKDVPVIHYDDYNLEAIEPDMIFIHNPYDDCNNLTRVPERFYSRNLKKHTRCLVYSPYFTVGRYSPEKAGFQYNMPGTYNADRIIVQSESVKRIFESFGHPAEKLIVFGSPKIDALVKKLAQPADMPPEWEQKLCGKTVFLLNTHLSYFPKVKELAVKTHTEILNSIINRPDCALIWRPHPLLKNMLKNRAPEYLEFIESFEQRIMNSENCVIDTQGDYSISFRVSDAMISTYSSLINEYMVTGKPVLIFQKKPDLETAEGSPINYWYNYYRYKPDVVTYPKFIDMVKNNYDPLKEGRMEMLSRAFANSDGTAGYKAYRAVLNATLNHIV